MKSPDLKIISLSLFLFLFSTRIFAQNTPEAISPGKPFEPGEMIKLYELVFRWNELKNASGYNFSLSKKNREGIYELIFSSIERNPIQENFYILPAEIVQSGGDFRWNVRAKIRNAWGQFSQRLYFRIQSKVETLSTKVEPEKQFSEPGIALNTSIPQINWSAVPTATAYAIYISKKNIDGKYELIYDSEKSGLIRDTFLQVPKGLLTSGVQYRWNMRAYNIAGWGEFSPRIYFSLKELIPQKELAMDNQFQDKPRIMKTLSPIFHWNKVNGASGYGLILKLKDASGRYKEIFNTEKIGLIKDTFYYLSKELLQNNLEYGWQIRSYNFAGWGSYSDIDKFIVKIPATEEITKVKPTATAKREIETINTLTPKFNWFKLPAAKKYGLQIKAGNDSKNFNLIYDSEVQTEIRDTFFTIPKKILKEGIEYSWNLRAGNEAGWGEYGTDFYFKIQLENNPTTPNVILPGGLNSEEIINTFNPVFTWSSSDYAQEYFIYISQKDENGNYKLIFNSEENSPIADTFFVASDNLLKNKSDYRWNVRSKNSKGFSNYSEKKYFRIELIRQPSPPTLASPGYKSEIGETINSLVPTFRWNSIQNSDSYSLFISQQVSERDYKLIYDSEKYTAIQDTFFTLPKNILENGKAYSWNIKASSKAGWKVYSERFYFKVSVIEKPIESLIETPISTSELEEVFLVFQYAGVVNSNITALYHHDRIYLPICEILHNLQITNSFLKEESKVVGKFDKHQNEFTFDFKSKKFVSDWKYFSLDENEIINYESEYYAVPHVLEQAFNLKTKLDLGNLTLSVSADKSLPAYDRFLIEQKFSSFKKRDIDLPNRFIYKRNRSWFNGLVMDYSFSSTFTKRFHPTYLYSSGVGGEILGGDANIQLRGFTFENANELVEEFRWRYVLANNNYLTQISLGDLFSEGINTYNFRGIKVTNEPFEPRLNIGKYIYRDQTEPNWIIEYYINDQLMGITKSDVQGYYSFEIPLGYGMSLTELKYYGPAGEYRSERKVFQIPFYFLPGGEFNYFISAGNLEQTKERFGQASAALGITDWLTNKTGIEFIDNSFFNKPIYFNSLSMRFSSNYLMNIFTAPQTVNKVSLNATYFSHASIGLSYANHKQNPLFNPSNIIEEIQGSLYLPIPIEGKAANFQFAYNNLKLNQAKRDDYRLNFSFNFNQFSPFIGGVFSKTLSSSSRLEESMVSIGSLINLTGISNSISFLKGSIINARLNYNPIKRKIENTFIYFASSLFNYLRFQISYEKNFTHLFSNIQLQLFMDLPFTRYSINANRKTYSQNIQGAIGYNFEVDRIYFSNQAQRGRSAVIFQMFSDDNGNSIYDSNENIIQGAEITIDAATRIEKNQDGSVTAYELNPYTIYTARVNEAKVKNPIYTSLHSEFSFVTDPNRMKVIQVPFYAAGDVSGRVIRYLQDEKILLNGLKLIITNLDEQSKITTSTFSDGSFYYFGLKPGNYQISLDNSQLQKLNLKAAPNEYKFSISSDTGIGFADDLEFTLQ